MGDNRRGRAPAAGCCPSGGSRLTGKDAIMIKTATFESLLEDARPDNEGGFTFTLEGKTYRIKDRDEVRKIAEQHGYIIIY
jgi:hypothetical protein